MNNNWEHHDNDQGDAGIKQIVEFFAAQDAQPNDIWDPEFAEEVAGEQPLRPERLCRDVRLGRVDRHCRSNGPA